MATQSEFINTPVPVLNRSAFDKSFKNLLTTKVGTLTPVLVDELIPDSTIQLKSAVLAKLPPLASDTFMNVKLHLEAFYCPYRILYGGYADAMSGKEVRDYSSTAPYNVNRACMPSFAIRCGASSGQGNDFARAMGPGTLADYLGFKNPVGNVYPTINSQLFLNIFPFLAYHRIYDDWYRNSRLQVPVFAPSPIQNTVSPGFTLGSLPYEVCFQSSDSVEGDAANGNIFSVNISHTGTGSGTLNLTGNSEFGDGVNILSLRQRNFGLDYFTSALPTPTVGTTPTFVINSVGTADGSGNVTASGSFTIGALRSVNSLTQFAERNGLCGTRYDDWLKANYGVNLSAQIEGRAQYLGRVVLDVYSKGVSQTGVSASAGDVSTQNPFKTVGAQYGDAIGAGEGTLVDEFYVREPGILMVLASIVPHATYSTGAAPYLRHYVGAGWRTHLANQILENVGPQPIMKSELDGNLLFGSDGVFGYTDRYAEYKTKFDELHGLMRDGQSLEAFALQRSFGAAGAVLGSSFIEIPTNFLDQVSAVSGDISTYGCWMDAFFDYKVVQPLSRYSQPSLVMPAEHSGAGHTEIVRRSGNVL